MEGKKKKVKEMTNFSIYLKFEWLLYGQAGNNYFKSIVLVSMNFIWKQDPYLSDSPCAM